VFGAAQGKLKQETLRIYLFTYGSQYQALSSAQLCKMFEMDEKKARPALRSCRLWFGHRRLWCLLQIDRVSARLHAFKQALEAASGGSTCEQPLPLK
jgi:hypothetical protein